MSDILNEICYELITFHLVFKNRGYIGLLNFDKKCNV